MKRKKEHSDPADELFDGMPEHVKKVYRSAKHHKRKADRKKYMDYMTGKDTSE